MRHILQHTVDSAHRPRPERPARAGAAVEFADGARVELRSLEWRRIKPLIWW